MPKYDYLPGFWREFNKLSVADRAAFLLAVQTIIYSLKTHQKFPSPPMVQKMKGYEIWEVRWAANGRATFHIEEDPNTGEDITVWRRIGDHSILQNP